MDYVAVGIRSLLQFDSSDRFSKNYAGRSKRTLHLPRMNASNHLRCAVSSLTREAKGIVSVIAAKDRLQFLIKVLVVAVVGFNVAGTRVRRSSQVQRGALISLFALCRRLA